MQITLNKLNSGKTHTNKHLAAAIHAQQRRLGQTTYPTYLCLSN